VNADAEKKNAMKKVLVMIVLAAVAGSASAALVTTTTYTGTGDLVDVVYDNDLTNGVRGTVVTVNSDSWDNGIPSNANPGLFDGSVGDGTAELAGASIWYGTSIRQTGGTLSDTSLAMRGGAQDGSTTHNILEIDDASNASFATTNLAISGQLTLWVQFGAGNTLRVLNGYADIGNVNATSPNNATINILNGRLAVGYFGSAKVTVNMLAGGTGEFILDDMDDGGVAKAELGNMVLNFETGSGASFTIVASNVTGNAQGAWEAQVAAGKVYIDGVVETDLSQFTIEDVGATGTKISLDLDPPTPNPATFSSAPRADGTAISMTATTGTDSHAVWYYFANTNFPGGSHDSGWQTSPSYTDSGLDEHTQYTYTVQMRDSATTPNVGTASSPASATTTAFAGDSFRPLPISSSSSIHVNLDLLQWILPAGTGTITCDVVMGIAPVLADNGFLDASDAGNTLIVDGLAVEEVDPGTYTGGDPLDMDTVYYWQVAVYDSAISTTVPSEVSPLYKFKTFDRYMEKLDRGLVAMNIGEGNVYLGWRLFKSDPSGPEFGFNVYRNGVKLTGAPITDSTNYLDTDPNLTIENTYAVYPVYPVSDEMEGVASTFVLAADSDNVEIDPGSSAEDPAVYLAIPFSAAGGRSDTVDKMAVGDLDGDGKLDYVVKHPLGLYDPGVGTIGTQDDYKIAVYDSDGTFRWEVDLGPNITQGTWWSPMVVYDLDGDGKAEVITKTAPASAIPRNGAGYLLTGDEYFTIYDGETGDVRAQTNWIARGNVSDWGDSYGNRCNRHMLGIAYLDGIHPSLIVMRGLYQKMVVEAWNLSQSGELTKQWTWNRAGDQGGGFHQIRTGDVDGDGKEEIIHGSICIDDDGTTLWDTGEYHGDRLQLTDIDPDRPGLEIWSVQEDPSQYENPLNLRDASDGTLIYGVGDDSYGDVGRGLVADIDPGYDGLECWSSTVAGDLHDATGTYVAERPTYANSFVCDRAYWWGTDLLREISMGGRMFSWNYTTDSVTRIGTCDPIAVADVVGDWREEILYYDATNHKIKIGTAITVTSERFYTLMQDPIFRNDVSSSANGYQNSNYTTFYMGSDMAPPTPSTMTWSSPPAAAGDSSITMSATPATAYGFGGVEYYFNCETPGGHDSLWQTSPTYVDVLLSPGTQYTYKVKARGLSHLETAYSSTASATTDAPGSGSLPGLSVTNGTLYKEGEPYRAAGVNYCDMFQAMLNFPEYTGQTEYRTMEGLQFLGEQGIPFVRFWACGFWPSNWDLYFSDKAEWFSRMDLLVATAEAANVGLIPSLFWRTSTIPELMGEYRDAWGDPSSLTRQFMTNYVHEVVGRYMDSPAIWGWEFANEMNLGCDLPNWDDPSFWDVIPHLGVVGPATDYTSESNRMTYAIAESAFNAFSAEVRKLDTHRFITTGNSNPRVRSWNNRMNDSWTIDSYAEAKEAFGWMQPASMDMASVHIYPNGAELEYAEASGTANVLLRYREFCDDQNQALFVGECSSFWGQEGDLDLQRASEDALMDDLIASGADLIAPWVFDYTYDRTTVGLIREDNDYTWVLDKVREYDAKMRGEEPLSLAGVPVDWFDHNGIAPTGSLTLAQVEIQDLNGNGLMAWEDYMAGFQPLETGVVFSITGFERFPGATLRLSWQGGTNGLMTPYVIQSTTNLVDSTSWKTIGTKTREQGENIWTGTSTAYPARYCRVIVSP
jgi:rhamnogalacturonan endolyase